MMSLISHQLRMIEGYSLDDRNNTIKSREGYTLDDINRELELIESNRHYSDRYIRMCDARKQPEDNARHAELMREKSEKICIKDQRDVNILINSTPITKRDKLCSLLEPLQYKLSTDNKKRDWHMICSDSGDMGNSGDERESEDTNEMFAVREKYGDKYSSTDVLGKVDKTSDRHDTTRNRYHKHDATRDAYDKHDTSTRDEYNKQDILSDRNDTNDTADRYAKYDTKRDKCDKYSTAWDGYCRYNTSICDHLGAMSDKHVKHDTTAVRFDKYDTTNDEYDEHDTTRDGYDKQDKSRDGYDKHDETIDRYEELDRTRDRYYKQDTTRDKYEKPETTNDRYEKYEIIMDKYDKHGETMNGHYEDNYLLSETPDGEDSVKKGHAENNMLTGTAASYHLLEEEILNSVSLQSDDSNSDLQPRPLFSQSKYSVKNQRETGSIQSSQSISALSSSSAMARDDAGEGMNREETGPQVRIKGIYPTPRLYYYLTANYLLECADDDNNDSHIHHDRYPHYTDDDVIDDYPADLSDAESKSMEGNRKSEHKTNRDGRDGSLFDSCYTSCCDLSVDAALSSESLEASPRRANNSYEHTSDTQCNLDSDIQRQKELLGERNSDTYVIHTHERTYIQFNLDSGVEGHREIHRETNRDFDSDVDGHREILRDRSSDTSIELSSRTHSPERIQFNLDSDIEGHREIQEDKQSSRNIEDSNVTPVSDGQISKELVKLPIRPARRRDKKSTATSDQCPIVPDSSCTGAKYTLALNGTANKYPSSLLYGSDSETECDEDMIKGNRSSDVVGPHDYDMDDDGVEHSNKLKKEKGMQNEIVSEQLSFYTKSITDKNHIMSDSPFNNSSACLDISTSRKILPLKGILRRPRSTVNVIITNEGVLSESCEKTSDSKSTNKQVNDKKQQLEANLQEDCTIRDNSALSKGPYIQKQSKYTLNQNKEYAFSSTETDKPISSDIHSNIGCISNRCASSSQTKLKGTSRSSIKRQQTYESSLKSESPVKQQRLCMSSSMRRQISRSPLKSNQQPGTYLADQINRPSLKNNQIGQSPVGTGSEVTQPGKCESTLKNGVLHASPLQYVSNSASNKRCNSRLPCKQTCALPSEHDKIYEKDLKMLKSCQEIEKISPEKHEKLSKQLENNGNESIKRSQCAIFTALKRKPCSVVSVGKRLPLACPFKSVLNAAIKRPQPIPRCCTSNPRSFTVSSPIRYQAQSCGDQLCKPTVRSHSAKLLQIVSSNKAFSQKVLDKTPKCLPLSASKKPLASTCKNDLQNSNQIRLIASSMPKAIRPLSTVVAKSINNVKNYHACSAAPASNGKIFNDSGSFQNSIAADAHSPGRLDDSKDSSEIYSGTNLGSISEGCSVGIICNATTDCGGSILKHSSNDRDRINNESGIVGSTYCDKSRISPLDNSQRDCKAVSSSRSTRLASSKPPSLHQKSSVCQPKKSHPVAKDHKVGAGKGPTSFYKATISAGTGRPTKVTANNSTTNEIDGSAASATFSAAIYARAATVSDSIVAATAAEALKACANSAAGAINYCATADATAAETATDSVKLSATGTDTFAEISRTADPCANIVTKLSAVTVFDTIRPFARKRNIQISMPGANNNSGKGTAKISGATGAFAATSATIAYAGDASNFTDAIVTSATVSDTIKPCPRKRNSKISVPESATNSTKNVTTNSAKVSGATGAIATISAAIAHASDAGTYTDAIVTVAATASDTIRPCARKRNTQISVPETAVDSSINYTTHASTKDSGATGAFAYGPATTSCAQGAATGADTVKYIASTMTVATVSDAFRPSPKKRNIQISVAAPKSS